MQLSVPNRTAPKNGSFNSKAASVKEWIDRLPMANIGTTTRLLFEALTDLNHQDIPAQQRFKALEMLRKPVEFVTDRMKKHFVGQPLPLADKNLKVARLSREITHSLATGYKVLVMEQLAGIGRSDRKLLITSIHRATKLLGSVLVKAYQVYESYPDSVWLEIHSLYRYAEANGLHNTAVADDHARSRKGSTIADAYKQILLLALACPYRLRQAEVEQIYQALELWAPFAELQRVGEKGSALFSTNLDSDQPPSYLVLREAGANRSTCRALNTVRLADQVRQTLAAMRNPDSRPPVNIGAQTLRHLMLVWGVMPKRRYARAKDSADVVVSVGLSSIHYFVSGEAAFNNTPSSPEFCPQPDHSQSEGGFTGRAHFAAHEVKSRRGQLPDVWEMNYRMEGEAAPTSVELAVARAAAGPQIDTTHRAQNWKMVNVSAGGYCLLWDNPEATRAQVGELLGIREECDPDTFHWRLGVIRWLKCADKPGLELGVQMLSPGAVAIAACPDKGKVTDENYTRGLLLPEIASIQQQATLLLPSPPFRRGDTAIANCQGRLVRVRLTKLVENTGSFAQFQFTSLGEVEHALPKHTSKRQKPGDFSDVWDLL
jgi:hypothetical protein